MTKDYVLKRAFERFFWLVVNKYCRLQTNNPTLPKGPYIICSNHNSHLDSLALMFALKRSFQDFNMLAAQDHFQSSSNSKAMIPRLLNLIYLDREARPIETRRLIKECKRASDQNKVLIIYPEGTRSIDGKLQPFKSGAVYLACKLNLPIIPAAIFGTGKALPRNSWFIRPKNITVHFGEQIIMPDSNSGLDNKSVLKKVTQELEMSVNALLSKISDAS